MSEGFFSHAARFLTHINFKVVVFASIAVAAFWFAIQICWSVVGKRWYSVVWRLVVALALFGVGFGDDLLYSVWRLSRLFRLAGA